VERKKVVSEKNILLLCGGHTACARGYYKEGNIIFLRGG